MNSIDDAFTNYQRWQQDVARKQEIVFKKSTRLGALYREVKSLKGELSTSAAYLSRAEKDLKYALTVEVENREAVLKRAELAIRLGNYTEARNLLTGEGDNELNFISDIFSPYKKHFAVDYLCKNFYKELQPTVL